MLRNYSIIRVKKTTYVNLLKEKGRMLQSGQKASFDKVIERLLKGK